MGKFLAEDGLSLTCIRLGGPLRAKYSVSVTVFPPGEGHARERVPLPKNFPHISPRFSERYYNTTLLNRWEKRLEEESSIREEEVKRLKEELRRERDRMSALEAHVQEQLCETKRAAERERERDRTALMRESQQRLDEVHRLHQVCIFLYTLCLRYLNTQEGGHRHLTLRVLSNSDHKVNIDLSNRV